MHSRTLAGVGADRRELAAVTRRDHEQAAATEAVGHGRNRPGAGREPRGLTAAAAPPAQAALGGPGPGRSGSELSRHQQNHSAARAPCGPLPHSALCLWRRRRREDKQEAGCCSSESHGDTSSHARSTGGGRRSFTSLRAGISLGLAHAWPLWVPGSPWATPGPLGSRTCPALILRTFQSQHRRHTARSSEEEASKPTMGPGLIDCPSMTLPSCKIN